MKVSEVTIDHVKEYGRITDDYDDVLLVNILSAAKQAVKAHTGLTDVEIDLKEDIPIAVLTICNEMYLNRMMNVENGKANEVIRSILDGYCVNLL